MNIAKRILKFSPFFIVAFATSLFLIEAQKTYSYNKTLESIPTVAISTTPAPATVVNSEMTSPEGSKVLKLTVTKNSDQTTNTISVLDNENSTEIAQIKPPVYGEFQIPFNTWSPDRFYFFMKTDNDYYVFQSSGEAFPTGEEYIAINSLFEENKGDYSIDEVTGWADNTLLLVNTHSDSGDKVSFWFDVPSKSFIQLGNYFE